METSNGGIETDPKDTAGHTSALRSGDLVRLVGFTGRATGVTATVSRITTRGVWVKHKDGRRECWHPSDVRRVRKAVAK
jgi:hypothetical protein